MHAMCLEKLLSMYRLCSSPFSVFHHDTQTLILFSESLEEFMTLSSQVMYPFFSFFSLKFLLLDFSFFFWRLDNWISCAQINRFQHFGAKEESSSFFFHHHLLSSVVFLCSCISFFHCRNKGIKFNGFPYL